MSEDLSSRSRYSGIGSIYTSDEVILFSDRTTELESVAHSKYSCVSIRKSSISSYIDSSFKSDAMSSGNDASDRESVYSVSGKCPLLLISS